MHVMDANSPSDADAPDTTARIGTKPLAANRLNDTAEMVAAALVADATDYPHFRHPTTD
jgi:putative transposase